MKRMNALREGVVAVIVTSVLFAAWGLALDLTAPVAAQSQPSRVGDPIGTTEVAPPVAEARDERIAPSSQNQGIRALEMHQDRLVLVINPPQLDLIEYQGPEGVCLEPSLSGYATTAEPGHPALPSLGTMAGLPPQSVPAVRVTRAESTVLRGSYNLCPEPQPVLEESPSWDGLEHVASWVLHRDAMAYSIDTDLPAVQAVLAYTGMIRDQYVAQLQVFPLQYNPVSGQIRFFTEIEIELSFNAPSSTLVGPGTPGSREQGDALERFLEGHLLNYEQALPWRLSPSYDASTVPPTALARASTLSGTAPAYRIETHSAGIYAVTFEELQAADPGIDLSTIDPRYLQILNKGQEVAIEIDQTTPELFGPGDVVRFYAEEVNTLYTDTNVYWLIVGTEDGQRITPLDATPQGVGTPLTYFVATRHLEEDRRYAPAYPDQAGDIWYWGRLTSAGGSVTGTYAFEVPNPVQAVPTATMEGRLRGSAASPYHSVKILLNSHTVYTNTWPTGSDHTFTVTIPSTHIRTGANQIQVVAGGQSASNDVYVNRFALTHSLGYTATADLLRFEADDPGLWEFNLNGFTTDAVMIWDITDPRRAIRIAGAQTRQSSPAYTLAFEQQIDAESRYIAMTPSSVLSPLSITRDTPSDLLNTDHQVDYILITHSDFVTAAETLAGYRTAQGLSTIVVDVQDIYDEFTYGIVDAEAIRDFLAYAFASWQRPAPAYVVMLGDGHIDPKDNLGFGGAPSYIPPYLADVDPYIRVTAADNKYVAVGDDGRLPQMALGRLPVDTLQEATDVINKIVAYEQAGPSSDWQARVLFVADNRDDILYNNFPYLSDLVADHYVPDPYVTDRVYLGVTHDTAVSARSAVTAAINDGRLIVNYVGHGSITTWAGERLLSRDILADLTNTGKLPFMVPMTCLEGYFVRATPPGEDYSSLAEALVRLPTTGAIASWSATGQGIATGHDYLHRGLYEAIFQEDIIELGPATTYAKHYLAAGTPWYRDLLDTYLLFGDPATRLNVLPADLQVTKAVAGNRTGFTSGEMITYTITYTNAGLAGANRVVISDTLPAVLSSLAWTSSGTPITQQVGSAYVWDAGSLPAGAGGVITVTGVTPLGYQGTLINRVEISTTTREVETGDNAGQVTVQVAPNPTDVEVSDLTVVGASSSTYFRPGDPITFTLTFLNAGPEIAHTVVLTNALPDLITNASWTSSGAPITQRAGSRFVWDVADLMPDAGGTVTVVGVIGPSLYTGPLTNVVTISTGAVDIYEGNNTAGVTVMLAPHRVYLPLTLRGRP